ncbi:hypothetical protein [Archaeoglobus neptunius]|uniref:hypothetical protein n=1 Tax=Archaeoglobus neptunius TaxID=2798580 RepID=UPI001928E23F|nr:hypothetical protein [Archaeoglobus neptunius]
MDVKRIVVTIISPLILHFYIPIPVAIALVRRNFLYALLPIIAATFLVSDRISYGPFILYPVSHFTIPALALFAAIITLSILLARHERVWKILIFIVIAISILHSLTPVFKISGECSGCREVVINFLDSKTVFCLRLSSGMVSETKYYHLTIFPLKSEGVIVTGLHPVRLKIDSAFSFAGGHASFYAGDIRSLELCCYPETIIGTIPVPVCSSLNLE